MKTLDKDDERELPYGIWREADGAEVIFNRGYTPLWRRAPDGTVTRIPHNPDAKVWIEWVKQTFLYETRTPPDRNKAVRQRCEALLREWGVADNNVVLMQPAQK